MLVKVIKEEKFWWEVANERIAQEKKKKLSDFHLKLCCVINKENLTEQRKLVREQLGFKESDYDMRIMDWEPEEIVETLLLLKSLEII